MRAFGAAVLLPLSWGLGGIGFRAESSGSSALLALLLGVSVAVVAVRAARTLLRNARERGGA